MAARRRCVGVKAERLERRTLLAASLLKDINTATDWSSPSDFTSVGSNAYFVAQDPVRGLKLWNTDGTSAGTHTVANGLSNPYDLTPLNGKLYFAATDANSQNELYLTDGTEAGTTPIAPLDSNTQYAPGQSLDLTAAGGKLFYVAHVTAANPAGIWVTDGTPVGIVPLTGSAGPPGTSPRDLTVVGNLVYFTADDGNGSRALWKTDGTPSGTILVADFPTVAVFGADLLTQFAAAGDRLFFLGPSAQSTFANELWISNGTAAGTQPLGAPGFVGSMIGLGRSLLFSAYDPDHGQELWMSDGTPGGTGLLKDIVPGTAGSNPSSFVVVGNEAFFLTTNAVWKTDGTPAGTAEVYDFGNVSPLYLAAAGPTLYVATGQQWPVTATSKVWAIDSNTSAAVLLANVYVPATSFYSGAFAFAAGDVVFAADDGVHGTEPWVSDGTPAGTHLVTISKPTIDAGGGTTAARTRVE